MSLIEKAAGSLSKSGEKRDDEAERKERRSLIEKGVREFEDRKPASDRSIATGRSQASLQKRSAETPRDRRTQINFAALREAGFFSPSRQRTRLGMELRAVKRRLLSKLGFFEVGHGASSARSSLVLFTSSRPGEGKTFLALNMALSLAFEDETPVLLVDADLNRPKIAPLLGLPAGRGFGDLLRDDRLDPRDVAYKAEGAPLHIITSGLQPDDGDLFTSHTALRAIEQMRERYGECVVIFDAPPVLATTEAMLLAKQVDEILFVVQANETRAPMLETAIEELADCRDKISFLLNFCAINKDAGHYGSYYEYTAGAARNAWSEDPGPDADV